MSPWRKALSAVHRLGGRFGRGWIVDHLLGKTKDAHSCETQMSHGIELAYLARLHGLDRTVEHVHRRDAGKTRLPVRRPSCSPRRTCSTLPTVSDYQSP
jgi:hypothetical protein